MKRSLGFTLVELVVVISILAVLTTAGLASFVSYSRTQSLQTTASDLITTLNLAKSRSSSQVKPDSSISPDMQNPCAIQPLNGYRVLISTPTNSYEMDAICAENIYKIINVTFPTNISVSQNGTTSTSFLFPVISGGVVGSGSVVLTGYGLTRTITVDSIGTVK